MSGLNYGNKYCFTQSNKNKNEGVCFVESIGKWLVRIRKRTKSGGICISTHSQHKTEIEAVKIFNELKRKTMKARKFKE